LKENPKLPQNQSSAFIYKLRNPLTTIHINSVGAMPEN